MRRAAAVFAGGAGVVVWDYKTCHPSRRHGYDTNCLLGTVRRVHNKAIAPLTGKAFTIRELATYDGQDGRRTYVGCGGRVFDVSDSEMFKDSYKMWAGRDATVSLGLMSMAEEDAGRTDFECLGEDEWTGVKDWELYFDPKYLVRGRLVEFDEYVASGKCTTPTK